MAGSLPFGKLRLQGLVRVQQIAGGPDDIIFWNADLKRVIVEIVVKFVPLGKVDRIPAVFVIVNGDAGIEICEKKCCRVDRSFAAALHRNIIVPFEGDLYGIMRGQFLIEFGGLPRVAFSRLPGLDRAIFRVFIESTRR